MNRLFAKTSVCKLAAAALFTSVALLVTGCGMGSPAAPLANNAAAGTLTGHAMGGATPIQNAVVEIWATGSAYQTATLLGEATNTGTAHHDTDATGSFTFPTAPYAAGVTCAPGQEIYLTVTGGSAGGGTNTAIVEVDALGRCEDLYNISGGVSTTYKGTSSIRINEATTVAAAYALGHFSTVVTGNGIAAGGTNPTGTGLAVLIGADAGNNAAEVSGVSTGTTTAAAGLYHAFENAALLVDSFAGVPNTTSSGGGIIPQALVDHIANITTACVNSTGAGDGAACDTLFSAVGGSPTNSFAALVNLAANPTLSGTPASVATLYADTTAQTAIYTPDLTTATGLNDFSIGINYPAGLGTSSVSACSVGAIGVTSATQCLPLTCPQGLALDANDNAYVGNSGAAACATTPTNVFAFSSNGNLNSISPNSGTFKSTYGLSVDAAGHGYYVQGNGSSTSGLIGVFAYSNGVVSAAPALVTTGTGSENGWTAVDQAGNVWINALNGIWKSAAPVTASSFTNLATSATLVLPATNFKNMDLAIDPQQNIWDSSIQTVYVLPNSGTLGTPAYANANLITVGSVAVNDAIGISFAGSSATNYTAYIGGNPGDNAGGTAGLQPFTVTLTGATVSSPTAGTNIVGSIAGAADSKADGAGLIWVTDATAKAVIQVNPAGPTTFKYEPCLVAAGACSNALGVASTNLYAIAVDSTGSIWTTTAKSSSVVQIIGAAAPTWPLLSLGKIGIP